MTNDKQKIVAEFDRCSVCGSTRRFAEEVAKGSRDYQLKDIPRALAWSPWLPMS